MDKSCANHPESMALATCKACDKSVCLMCVVDEKEGTFCSSECHTAFASGQEVPKFAAAAEPVAASAGVAKLDSIFDDEPAPAATQSQGLPVPPDESIPIVAEGTKWRSIGAQCDNHADTPAVANCDRCGKAVCALCLLEAAQGTFCSAECMSSAVKQQPTAANAPQASAPAERAALQGKPVFHFKAAPKTFNKGQLVVAAVVIALLAGGGYYGWVTLSPTVFPPDVTPNPNVSMTPDPVTPTKTTTPDPTKTTPANTDPTKTTSPTKTTTTKTDPAKTDPAKTDPSKTTPANTDSTTPRVKRPPPVKPQPIYTRKINPWEKLELGAWFRIKTDRGGKVEYSDVGLKERGADYYVLATQTSKDGQASAVNETKNPVASVVLKGEETFKFEDRSYLCEIQATGPEDDAAKTWALIAGKNAGAVLKFVSPRGTIAARRVWEHTLRVKNQSFDCLVVEAQMTGDGPSRIVKSWYSASVPTGLVQQEREGEFIELVDFGSDWSKRPAFPAK